MKSNHRAKFILSGLMIAVSLMIFGSRPNYDSMSNHSSDFEYSGSSLISNWYSNQGGSGFKVARAYLNNYFNNWLELSKYKLASAGMVLSPLEVTVVINPGMRREEIAELLAPKLNWSEVEKNEFARLGRECYVYNSEGEYLPGRYTFLSYTTPSEAEEVMRQKFSELLDVILSGKTSADPIVSEALKVASLLEREAAGHGDERIIAGIIWNRIYADMNLQLDATLQYAKGRPGNWWPVPKSRDKYIDSPYNTYLNPGLPPAPIANPSIKMLLAALNPEPTDCYFYLHAKREFYCSPDYKGHLKNIRRYL